MKKMIGFVFALLVGLVACDNGSDLPKADIDLDPFLELTKNAGCHDIANRLFLIDKRLIFWEVRGNCPDGSYTLILFEETVNDTVCIVYDSIAGPQGFCRSRQPMFDTITNNLDRSDLGLGSSHHVERIEF